MTTYNIWRIYQDDRSSRLLKSGVSLAEAQEHCNDPETSSRTRKSCQNSQAEMSKFQKHWFDSYQQEAE